MKDKDDTLCYICNKEMLVISSKREDLGLPRRCHLDCIGRTKQ